MGISISSCPKEEWKVAYLCGLLGIEQGNTKISLPSPIHWSSPWYFSREVVLFISRQLQWLQLDSNHPWRQRKTTFTCPWVTFTYIVLPFGLCNTPTTFQKAILNIFANQINKGLEVYMDDFTPYEDDFDQALQTLEKVLEWCIATRVCLSNVKCHMMMTKGIILGHYISAAGIHVDPTKV